MSKNSNLVATFVFCTLIAPTYSSTGVVIPHTQYERTTFTSSGSFLSGERATKISKLSKNNSLVPTLNRTKELITSGSASLINELHEKSGLTWDQLASLFDVSRRSMHHWAAGEKMNSSNLTRLTEITDIVNQLEGSSPEDIRIQFLSTSDGKSLLMKLREENFAGERALREPNLISKRLGAYS